MNLEELYKDPIYLLGISIVFIICLCMILLYSCEPARAEEINWDKLVNAVIQVESNGNPNAYNKKSGAIGLMQITPIVLKEFNQFNQERIGCSISKYYMQDHPNIQIEIGTWYLSQRIPQMLLDYQKPITIDNLLISYNAGISYVVKNKLLPSETRQYLKKVKAIYQKEG